MNAKSAVQAMAEKITVALNARSYDILIEPGALRSIGARLKKLKPDAAVFILADAAVEKLHGDTLRHSFTEATIKHKTLTVTPGEASKSFAALEKLIADLVSAGIERRDAIVALGGGVIGDLAGFAAAIALRGIGIVHAPTTLLAQVDSSIGGKTGINLPQGKNLVGAYHQPLAVITDPDVLATLPPRELRAGYAEIAKAALINDGKFFAWLEQNATAVFSGGTERVTAIANACRIKADIVMRDEHEKNERMLLNLGHTFGHALETAAGFSDKLLHGEAVAIGTAMAFRFSSKLGLCGAGDAERVERHLQSCGLPTRADKVLNKTIGAKEMFDLMAKDKKIAGGQLTLILARGIGEAFIARNIEAGKIVSFLKDELEC